MALWKLSLNLHCQAEVVSWLSKRLLDFTDHSAISVVIK